MKGNSKHFSMSLLGAGQKKDINNFVLFVDVTYQG